MALAGSAVQDTGAVQQRRSGGRSRPPLDAMPVEERDKLKARVRDRMPADSLGRVTWSARANAVKARVRS
jgi:hypothetical protein